MTAESQIDPLDAGSIPFTFDGQAFLALPGETLGAALARSGVLDLRVTRNGQARGLHCGMGACFDCLVTINGRAGERACMTKVANGDAVTRSMPRPEDLKPLTDMPTAMAERTVDVLIIGAGPAGLIASQHLADLGLDVCIVDERTAAGGQYYKPLAVADNGGVPDSQFRDGARLEARARAAGATLLLETSVWSASLIDGFGLYRNGHIEIVRPRRVLLATGASERPCPVPGWTLPGVMTTGGLQSLVRAQRLLPGQRIVIAGSGPLNLQLACEILRLGGQPVAMIDRAPAPGPTSLLPLTAMLRSDPSATLSGLAMLVRLFWNKVPVHWGQTVAGITGMDRVTGILVDGPNRRREIPADIVALNVGFVPQLDLARQLGCEERIERDVPALQTDQNGRTSIASVFAIGDGASIGGARVALAMGEIAAGAIARDLGKAPRPSTRPGPRLARAQAFQKALWTLFDPDPFDVRTLANETIVCRCEEVSAGAVRSVCRTQDATLATVKRMTRAGMGRCQGRFCVPTLVRMVALEGGPQPSVESFLAPRPPAKPVPLSALAFEKGEWGGHRQTVPPAASPRVDLRRPPIGDQRADVVVIGAGVVGACVALELARSGLKVVVVDRHEPNVQASGANAGSLHVQLLSFDFGAKAQAGGQPAADVLRIAPAAIELWKSLERDAAESFEITTPGGLMVAENDAEMAFLRQKVALEQSYGIDANLIGSNELRALEPHLSQHLVGAAYCRDEGKINPLTATLAIVRMARAAGVRFESFASVQGLDRSGTDWRVTTEVGTLTARRIVNCAGGWASRIAEMASKPIPVSGAPLQMIVTEPGPAMIKHLVAHGGRHLSLKQADTGGLIIGGAWPAQQDGLTGASHVERASIEGNAWVACHVLPAARGLRALRVWAGMNIHIDGAPIIGEMPGAPGFFNCVTSNGYTLAPIVARLTADLMCARRPDFETGPFLLDRFNLLHPH